MKEKITAKLVTGLKTKAKRTGSAVMVWDEELRGFGLRVSPTGRVSVFIEKWQGGRGGKGKRVVIGSMPPLELEDARAEAQGKLSEIAKGADLVDKKTQARIAKRLQLQSPKLGDAISLYVKRHREEGSYWDEVARKFEKDVKPVLGASTRINEIALEDVRRLLNAKLDKGQNAAARYLFAVLRPFFKWCVGEGYTAVNPLISLPSPKPSKSRDRKLSDREIKALWKVTEGFGYPWRPFYRLLLLTGQRREEVAGIDWRELDLDQRVWAIPKEKTKNGKEHLVHLSEQAVFELRSCVAHRKKQETGEDLVFSTTGKTPISGFGRAKERLDKGIGADDWVVHDLRRTCASGMARIGIEPHVTERVLNHLSGSQGGLQGVYQQYEYLPERKQALERWGVAVALIVWL